MLKRVSIKIKLIGGLVMSVAMTMIIAWVGLSAASSANTNTQDMFEHEVAGLNQLSQTIFGVLDIRQLELLHTMTNEPAEKSRLEAEIAQTEGRIYTTIQAMKQATMTPAERESLSQLESAWSNYIQARNNQTLSASRAGQNTAAHAAASGPVRQSFKVVEDVLNTLMQSKKSRAEERIK